MVSIPCSGGPGGSGGGSSGVGAASASGRRSSARADPAQGCGALLVELVGSRFLRRMVRVLVATALRESIPGAGRVAGGGADALVQLAQEQDRSATALPAPAAGLCFAGVGYGDLPPPLLR